jgi:hypothetical protein
MSRYVQSMRRSLVDASRGSSLSDQFRARRFDRLLAAFPDLAEMHVVDLGGTVRFWECAPARPARLVLVNLAGESAADPPFRPEVIVDDVCDPSPSLRSRRFDLVFSNSVIEHVGGHARRMQMAEVTRLLAPRHWVQTPYRYFPIEPHWVFPGYQFLPVWARARLGARWSLSWAGPVSVEANLANTLGVELLDRSTFKFYFPDAKILAERAFGLPKSLVAVRGGAA